MTAHKRPPTSAQSNRRARECAVNHQHVAQTIGVRVNADHRSRNPTHIAYAFGTLEETVATWLSR